MTDQAHVTGDDAPQRARAATRAGQIGAAGTLGHVSPSTSGQVRLPSGRLDAAAIAALQRSHGNQAMQRTLAGTAATLQRAPVEATSLSAATQGGGGDVLAELAGKCGYSGDLTDRAGLRAFVQTALMLDTDEELDSTLAEQARPQLLYQRANVTGLQADRLKFLAIPSTLNASELSQSAQAGACKGMAALAAMLLQNASDLQSVVKRQTPSTAIFQFPPADALTQYLAQSDDNTKESLQRIITAHQNEYAVKKEIHTGDLLPSSEPWVNLTLKAAHQHLSAAGSASSDSYETLVPLTVKVGGSAQDITFNLLSGKVGTATSGADLSPEDNALKGKTLHIGHGGHATVLVIKPDGSKLYFDNQAGLRTVQGTVEAFLSSMGMNTEATAIVVE